MMHVEAVAEVARRVSGEWGETYYINNISEALAPGSAVAEVWSSDSSIFYVAASYYGGRWAYADNKAECLVKLGTAR